MSARPTSSPTYHVPVLLVPTVEALQFRPGGIYLDLTFGGGGHSREILRHMDATSHLYGFDQDIDAYRNIPQDDRFTFIHSNFRFIRHWMHYYGHTQVDGILADLGVSSHHFDDEQRGFSFRFSGNLDMRMNTQSGLTAAQVIATYSEAQLADIFYLYGELKNARRIASTLVRARTETPLTTTEQLLACIAPLFKREREKKEIAKVFQALRIEVNQEMQSLSEMLLSATQLLAPGARLSVLTYHSLEDRLVKNVMRAGNLQGEAQQDFYGNRLSPLRPVNNKVIVADEAEIAQNPRSRSAKLRIAQKYQ